MRKLITSTNKLQVETLFLICEHVLRRWNRIYSEQFVRVLGYKGLVAMLTLHEITYSSAS